MKKLICVIIILLIIFIGIFYYKNIEKKTENVSMQEVEKIENYIDQIYLEKEILGEPIVYFNDISEADEKWIWQVVQKNIEDDKISYEQINQKAKEIFGEDLKKEFPKEGTKSLKYNEQEDKYEAIQEEPLDEIGTAFLINKIEKTKEGYEVELVEYLEDYTAMLKEDAKDNYIIIRNSKEEEISRTSNSSQAEELDIVKRNIDKFTVKKILLKSQDEKIYIKKVY